MAQYLLLKSDGERDDGRYGLTADDTSNNGVLGSDTYSASHMADALFPGRGEITNETINGKNVTVENDNYGKWVCVLNYEHFGGENPSVTPSSTFPQLPNGLSGVEDIDALGTSGELRHVDNITQYGSWSVDAVRLEAETSNHGRRIHYYTTDQAAIDAIVDDSVQAGSTALQADFYYPNHTAALPDVGNYETQASTNRIFGYDFPIYQGGEHHWALAGSGNRWEVDDHTGNENQTTVHRVWVRISQTPERGGGNTQTFDTTNTSSSSPVGGTQLSTLVDQLGSGSTLSSSTSNVGLASSSVLVGGGTSTTLADALRDTFSTASFVNSLSNTTAGGQTKASSLLDQLGSGFSETGPIVFDDFDDGDYSDWTLNEGTLTADSNQAIGTYSMFHDSFGGDDGAREAVKELDAPRQPQSFSFMYWETSSNTSAAISLYNSDGQRELSFGTDNPAWAIEDANDNLSFGNPGEYEDWMRFTITFNWPQNEYTIEGEDIETGYTASYTGTLYYGKDIAEVASGQVALAGYTGAAQWHLDQMQFNVTENGNTSLVDYDSIPATFTTSSIIDAITESFITVERTGVPNTASTGTGGTQIGAFDQFGSTSSTALSSGTVQIGSTNILLSDSTSTSITSAIRAILSSSITDASSSTNSVTGGTTPLADYTTETGAVNTSALVDAITETFDVVEQTGLGDALSAVTGDTTLMTTDGSTSVENAIGTALVASEQASAISQGGDQTFTDAFVSAIEASTFTTETIATFDNTSVTALGQIDSTELDGLTGNGIVEMFAFISPESASATPQTGQFTTETQATALTENAVYAPLTPTLSILLNVGKGDIGLEGSFADSLSASVGAQTSIEVAKTIGSTTTADSTLTTSAVDDALALTATFNDTVGDGTTSSTLNALRTAALYEALGGALTTETFPAGGTADISTADTVADGTLSSAVGGEVEQAVANVRSGTGNAEVTAEALAEAAQSLIDQGIATTEAQAAVIVSQAVSTEQTTTEFTTTTVSGLPTLQTVTGNIGHSTTETLSSVAQSVFSVEKIDSTMFAQALPDIQKTLVAASIIDGVVDTDAQVLSDVTTALASDVTASKSESTTTAVGIIEDSIADTIYGTANTSVTVDALAHTVDMLTRKGIVETKTTGAAVVLTVLASGEMSDVSTTVTGDALIEFASGIAVESGADTAVTAGATETLLEMDPLDAIIILLYASITGQNVADILSGQNIELPSKDSGINILSGSNDVRIL